MPITLEELDALTKKESDAWERLEKAKAQLEPLRTEWLEIHTAAARAKADFKHREEIRAEILEEIKANAKNDLSGACSMGETAKQVADSTNVVAQWGNV